MPPDEELSVRALAEDEDEGACEYCDYAAPEGPPAPGNPDSMVLKPNVRVMASRLRGCIQRRGRDRRGRKGEDERPRHRVRVAAAKPEPLSTANGESPRPER